MAKIPNIFLDCVMPMLNHAELKVMMIVLAEEDAKQNGYVKILNSLFTKKTRLSLGTIKKAIKSLEKKGLLYVVRRQPIYGYSSTLFLTQRRTKWQK